MNPKIPAGPARALVSALIVGTDHKYQRRQDRCKENGEVRDKFEEFLREVIAERNVDGMAEEAGNDQEVWQQLKAEEMSTPDELKGLFEGMEVVDAPARTIARTMAEASGLPYADIRSPQAGKMSIPERDKAMAKAIAERFGTAKSVLAIVGEVHRQEVARILHERFGWTTESTTFL